jgi:predicted RNA-binding Zn ribbon-like protein
METIQDVQAKAFDFSGEWLCLDFCNTADGDINQSWKENLTTYADLVAWSQQAGTLNDREATFLLHIAAQQPAQAESVLQEAVTLRFTIYHVFAAIAHEYPIEDEALEDLNTTLKSALAWLRVVPTEHGFDYAWDGTGDPLRRPLWPVVWSAAELLTSHDKLQLVRECGGPTCSWLFLDTSRNHRRRWCSMEGCGNRAKARRHYHRTKPESE